jgi:hypothetical protein
MNGVIIANFIWLILRVVSPIYCAMKADRLNRNTGLWAIFGFIFPIIAMIWASTLTKRTLWTKE